MLLKTIITNHSLRYQWKNWRKRTNRRTLLWSILCQRTWKKNNRNFLRAIAKSTRFSTMKTQP